MAETDLQISLIDTADLSTSQQDEILKLCSAAFGEDIAPYLRDIGSGRHVMATLGEELVSHAMWVTRDLQTGSGQELKTAYVELVATAPDRQGQGLATQVMEHLSTEIDAFDLAALSTGSNSFYERIGWELWQGPLSIRAANARVFTPDEVVMILRLPRTPSELDLQDQLSAEWRPGELW